MAKTKITILILIYMFLEIKTCMCETLDLDQKIIIFGELIKDNEPDFYIFLMHKTLEIYQFLKISNDKFDIEFYVWLLKQQYYS